MADGGHSRHVSETGMIPGHSRLSNRQSTFQNEDESAETSTIMSCLGYGAEIRHRRGSCYREWDRLMTARSGGNVTVITAGSKAEGATSLMESDRDCMFVPSGVLCVEDGIDHHSIPRGTTVFKMHTSLSYAGHSRLLLWKLSRCPVTILNALCDDGIGHILLSSDSFVYEQSKCRLTPGTGIFERAGPSLPWATGPFNLDRVHALRGHCPSILKRWAARTRHWPTPDIVQKVVSMGAFLTPVGFRGSEYKHIEWRICFNTSETELMNNLNDIQMKMYVMLKMVVKEVIKPRKKEVTSYVLKNIVLWLAEKNPQTLFHERSLLHWLHEGLAELRTAISTKQLAYYTIPDRNLMAACVMGDEQQRIWVAAISEMMSEGPMIILRLKKIRQAIIAHPEPLLWYSRLRTELEMLQIEYINRDLYCSDESMQADESDVILQSTHQRVNAIIFEVRERLYWEGSKISNVQEIGDRMLQ